MTRICIPVPVPRVYENSVPDTWVIGKQRNCSCDSAVFLKNGTPQIPRVVMLLTGCTEVARMPFSGFRFKV